MPLPEQMRKYLFCEFRSEEDETSGWNIITEDPYTNRTVQIAWCETKDCADFVVHKLNKKGE